ncbi:hypothetical protein Pelo_15704 [Pelomyxa schiedti]|nr:hypothetical protein Pelo_15704 [Pelomyxa schiedti]
MEQLIEAVMCPMRCDNGVMKDPVVLAKCQHSFCKSCIESWLNVRHRTCPVCRQPVLEHVGEWKSDDAVLYLRPCPTLSKLCEIVRQATPPNGTPCTNLFSVSCSPEALGPPPPNPGKGNTLCRYCGKIRAIRSKVCPHCLS